jgi:hypothetical protein
MIVIGWNNGSPNNRTGAGYGLKIDAEDRNRFFRQNWKNILLSLEGEMDEVAANVNKKSFWNPECGELISKRVGLWLIKHSKAPWPKGCPPKIRLEPTSENRFKAEFI